MYRLYITEYTDKRHIERIILNSIEEIFTMLEGHLLSTNNTKIPSEYMIVKTYNETHGDSVLMIYKTIYRQLPNIYGKDAYKEMKKEAIEKDRMLKGKSKVMK